MSRAANPPKSIVIWEADASFLPSIDEYVCTVYIHIFLDTLYTYLQFTLN